MNLIYHQIQGLYVAGDVYCAIDCVRALPEFKHVFFVNHNDGFDQNVFEILQGLGVDVKRNAIVTESDIRPELQTIFYHCVGFDTHRRGEYVVFRQEPPGVKIAIWIHTPGLCGAWSERYNYLKNRNLSFLIFNSSFSLHNTPGLDYSNFSVCSIINPVIDTDRFSRIQRVNDGIFRMGRWSRGHDTKYSDDFLELLSSINISGAEFLCMGIPGKFYNSDLPTNVRFLVNGAVPLEDLLCMLDLLIFKTHAPSWHEGWCRTVTEAMAAGIVPVVENRGGIMDQVAHGYNGFLCNTNAEFKYYCEYLFQRPEEMARIRANARKFAHDNYNLSNLRQDLLHLIKPVPMKRLNFGCGFDIRSGYVNFDREPLPGVDISASIDPYYPRLPFKDGEFDEILAFHVLEHVANKVGIMEELWRISRNNALIKIKLPDRNHSDAFLDPTHLSYWEVDTIDFFLPGHLRGYYTPTKFGLLHKHTSSREIYWELLTIRHRLMNQSNKV